MNTRYILLVLLVVINISNTHGQRRYAADRYFKEFGYQKSAELYQIIHDKGDNSYVVMSRLADSYYFISDYQKAEKAYAELMRKYENIASSEHVFRYAQVLKTNGKIALSDQWLLKLKAIDNQDSRVADLEKNSNYFEELSNTSKKYINIHNLSINTEFSEFSGFMQNDFFYFSSTRPDAQNKKLYAWNNQPFLNIYQSRQIYVNDNSILDAGDVKKVTTLSSKFHESNPVFTNDGSTVYFTRDNNDGKRLKGGKRRVANLKIYKAKKGSKGWGRVEELPFNNDEYSSGHPALSADEKTLYFSSDKPGGFGETDLYKVSINSDGSYSEPENLGKAINSEGKELFPFIGANNMLYFASDGHVGLGGLDIFEVSLEENNKGPVNLGVPINGPRDDFGFVSNEAKLVGFFSSNREGGKGDDDIYSFKIYYCNASIRGIVTDAKTGLPLKSATINLMDQSGVILAQSYSKNNGSYLFSNVDCDKYYNITASKEDYKSIQHLNEYVSKENVKVKKDFTITPLVVDDQIVINPIYFAYDLHTITEEAEYELEHIVSVMNNHPNMIIKIESHTDSRGSRSYNKTLSDKRAKATRDYIVSRGISADRIESAIGYGEVQLLNDCGDDNQSKCSEEEHAKNRRSYFIIVSDTIK
ncbi:OmpA family protein [Tenacibaculum sp. SG-28]|uniref:OmpA family protein n=1 Tax=Tenacibaculum sp. SG-28 TaxID=754426 RepID=UPI000CF51416|nr:OmpA family protein [Tenacibaculum sp. SG-28]PQJ21598.1 hypothetical protein BSU00_05670 [Tenacibaculum sp. SG-28]